MAKSTAEWLERLTALGISSKEILDAAVTVAQVMTASKVITEDLLGPGAKPEIHLEVYERIEQERQADPPPKPNGN